MQRINKWRMKKAGKDWMLTLHDVANGFPSPAHRRLNNMIRRVTPEEYNLIRHRHQRARVRMTFPGGKKKFYKIGCGTTQGDSIAPEEFVEMYWEVTGEWEENQRQREDEGVLIAADPLTGEKVDTALTSFADDTTHKKLAQLPFTMALKDTKKHLASKEVLGNVKPMTVWLTGQGMARSTVFFVYAYVPPDSGSALGPYDTSCLPRPPPASGDLEEEAWVSLTCRQADAFFPSADSHLKQCRCVALYG